jgi:hypothetical protein
MDPKSGSFVGLVHRSAISAAVAREDLLPRAGMSAQGKRVSVSCVCVCFFFFFALLFSDVGRSCRTC